jgi:putative ABC transport system permease protein
MRKGSALHLAVNQLKRDLRAGELTLLAAALVIAVAAMSAVGFFTDRVGRSIERQSASLLAADLAVQSPYPIPAAMREHARALHLATAATLSMRSMVSAGDQMQLAEVKAVGDGYPLRGQVSSAASLFGRAEEAGGVPAPGTAWAEARLMQTLGLKPGDSITVGAASLKLARVLVLEPDRGGDFFNIAPRLLMNLKDVPATQLVMPGSRVSHRLLAAGTPTEVEQFRSWVKARLDRNQRLLSVRDARPQVRSALTRASQFLQMAALVAVVLAGVAIAMAARRYAARHLDTCAIMRCLGATQRTIVSVLGLEMLILSLTAALAGSALGYAAQEGLAWLFRDLSQGALPPPSLAAAWTGVATGLVTMLGFALAPLVSLKDVPPLRVLRRDLGDGNRFSLIAVMLAAAAIMALAPWNGGDVQLSLNLLGACALTMIGLGAMAWLLVQGLGRLRSRVGTAWRFGLAGVARRARSSSVQIVALGLGIMVMLLMAVVRADLLAGWQASIPEDAPNHFLINIPPGQVQALKKFLADRGVSTEGIYPMIRGRLVAVNDKPVRIDDYQDDRARRLADRETNLSWAQALQGDNTITAGHWWRPGDSTPQFSIETGIADTLGLHLGDKLTYQVADRQISGRITSLRKVEWDSFNANFFVLARPGMLDGFPATWITSFYLDAGRDALLTALVNRFPSVTVIDVAAILERVRAIIAGVSHAVEYVFAFTVLAGLLVLVAAVQATQDERMHESAILKTLGATRAVVARGLAAEFLVLGAVAGTLAAAAAMMAGWLLATRVFHIDYLFDPWLWPAGVAAGACGVLAAGWFGLRRVMTETPAAVLRRTAG